MYKVCAFSGHRNLNAYPLDYNLLDRVTENLIKTGTEKFLCGMALGFDMAAAECVLNLKKKYEINLTACLPCADQSTVFSRGNKLRYENILDCCDEVITLSESYSSGCMHGRNRFMVDGCDALICFLRKKSGGTFYTVNYAKKLGKAIIEL